MEVDRLRFQKHGSTATNDTTKHNVSSSTEFSSTSIVPTIVCNDADLTFMEPTILKRVRLFGHVGIELDCYSNDKGTMCWEQRERAGRGTKVGCCRVSGFSLPSNGWGQDARHSFSKHAISRAIGMKILRAEESIGEIFLSRCRPRNNVFVPVRPCERERLIIESLD